ncbi:hypothetical protein CEXT_811941 [Caerostris extrusa]|uniref:Uncharacterized protein n=1 Tax=Caerostris extrusa TaxID=172846 RepID=A0AAV4SRH2_CAEEX|nr:hypothetical protein CEXT_811941 [Caerostris extrusa]
MRLRETSPLQRPGTANEVPCHWIVKGFPPVSPYVGVSPTLCYLLRKETSVLLTASSSVHPLLFPQRQGVQLAQPLHHPGRRLRLQWDLQLHRPSARPFPSATDAQAHHIAAREKVGFLQEVQSSYQLRSSLKLSYSHIRIDSLKLLLHPHISIDSLKLLLHPHIKSSLKLSLDPHINLDRP